MTSIRPREVTDVTTGESLALVPADSAHEFSMQQYLGSIATPAALQAQQRLAAAYDEACRALVGPNDVQREGGREFKKKSAWRKLGRHFRISTAVVRIDKEWTGDGHFLATVTVRATAPWGQSAESVGACGTDEATGRRTISTADAIATAETRATNRAVSNLIAMGEVSAEEMGNRGGNAPARVSQGGGQPRASARLSGGSQDDAAAFTMPFGKTKGTPLAELPDDEVRSALAWAESKGKFTEFQDAARAYLAMREGVPAGIEDAEMLDDLPPFDDEDRPW